MDNPDNKKLLAELEQNFRFESLLTELSAKFVHVPVEQIDQAIQESLWRIAENLDLGHIGLGEITLDGRDFFSTFQYAKSGTTPWNGKSLLTEGPLLTRTLLSGRPFIMHDVDALPSDGAIDREGLLRYGIRADLVFSLIIGALVWWNRLRISPSACLV